MGVEVICTKLLDKHHDLFIVDEFIRCRESCQQWLSIDKTYIQLMKKTFD